MKKLRGTGVAIVTPFKNDSSIDFNALKKITEHVISGGINYVVVMGTTGESATLTKMKETVLSYILEIADRRVPVITVSVAITSGVVNCIRYADLKMWMGYYQLYHINKPVKKVFTAFQNYSHAALYLS
jgi:dihydrodipicolinate synthase/N-acetylneuraminate lyase